ncbi:hypothetical protein MTO96_007213 [Rhipicephalus appendiculatus]
MRLLAVIVLVILAVTLCSDFSDAEKETVLKQTEFRRYMRFAHKMALMSSKEHARRASSILRITREGNEVSITFTAVDTKCKPGRRIPSPRRCPEIESRPIHTCTGIVKFLGGSFRRPKYDKKVFCTIIHADIVFPSTPKPR